MKIESVKLDFKEKAQAKVGSLENAHHVPGGGNVKVRGQPSEKGLTAVPPAQWNYQSSESSDGSELSREHLFVLPRALSHIIGSLWNLE